jgi:hypothetical protein
MIEHWTAGMADGLRFVDEDRALVMRPREPGVMIIDPGARATEAAR